MVVGLTIADYCGHIPVLMSQNYKISPWAISKVEMNIWDNINLNRDIYFEGNKYVCVHHQLI